MKILPRTATLLLLTILATLSGCSTLYEGKYAFSDGWRKGRVVRVTQSSAVSRPNYWQCLRLVPAISATKEPYVTVAYSSFGRYRERLVAAPPGTDLAENDAVYVNLGRCDEAITKRASAPRSQLGRDTVFSYVNRP